MTPVRKLLLAWLATVAVAAVLAALLLRPGVDLQPRRSKVIELDEPGPTPALIPHG